jgi:serralysin
MNKINRALLATVAAAAICAPFLSASAFQLQGSRWGGGVQGDAATVTWSVAPDGTSIPNFIGVPSPPVGVQQEIGGNSNLIARMRQIYGPGPADPGDPGNTNFTDEAWYGHINESYNRWSSVSGLTMNYESTDDGAAFRTAAGSPGVRGDMRIGGHAIDGSSGVLAYNFFPSSGGDGVLDTLGNSYENLINDSRKLRNVVVHEVGHGLGLTHTSGIANNLMNVLRALQTT